MIKRLGLLVIAFLFVFSVAFASVGIQKDGTPETAAMDLDFRGDVTLSGDAVKTVKVGGAYEVFSTDDTLVAADSGKTCIGYNLSVGSTGIIAFTLPAVAANLKYTFVSGSTNYITVDPAGTDAIMYSTNVVGDKIKSAGASADSVTLVSDGSRWYVSEMKGTWTDNN